MTHTLRIDSHQHFWQLARADYYWLNKGPAKLTRDFLPAELQPQLQQHGINYTVTVQATETLAETGFMLQLAQQHTFIAGVVGWVDMNLPDATEQLSVLHQQPKFVGIRPMIQGIADPNWMLKPELDSVFTWLIDNNLTFDALVKPLHLNALYQLLQRYPELKLVIDHGAKPDIAAHVFNPWADQLQKISEETAAYCKLSGLVTEAGADASFEKLKPYMTHLMNCFGAQRLMWGSDWPVCTLANPYGQWVETMEKFLAGYTPQEAQAIWGENAIRFYNLDLPRQGN